MNNIERIEKVFRTVLIEDNAAGFSESATMDEINSWDSLNFINIIIALEQEFDLKIDGLDAAEMTSIPRILGYIEDNGS